MQEQEPEERVGDRYPGVSLFGFFAMRACVSVDPPARLPACLPAWPACVP